MRDAAHSSSPHRLRPERCVLFCDTENIAYEDLPPDFSNAFKWIELLGPDETASPSPESGLKDQVKAATANLERRLITRALDQTGRNVTRTAQLLKISRKSLQTKMKELGLRDDPPEGGNTKGRDKV